LLAPTSNAFSKSGELKNLIRAVKVSTVDKANNAESLPELTVIVDDSLTEMRAAVEEVEVFSAKLKEELLVKVGAL
jgi:hypothetical protein